MSKNSEQNRALASALRSAGIEPSGEAWALAKQGINAGITLEGVLAELTSAGHAKRAKRSGKVSEPAAQYVAQKPKAKRAKAQRTRDFTSMHDVVLTREGAAALSGTVFLTDARKKAIGTGKTHDAQLVVVGIPKPIDFTLSPDALERLRSGNGTRMWVNNQAYVARLA